MQPYNFREINFNSVKRLLRVKFWYSEQLFLRPTNIRFNFYMISKSQVNAWKSFHIFAKSSILDVWVSSEYVSDIPQNIIDIFQSIQDVRGYEISEKNRIWNSLLMRDTYSLTINRYLPTRLVSEYKPKSCIFSYTVYKWKHTGWD